MNSSVLFVFVSLSIIALTSARFACGNDPLQASFAEMLVNNACKGKLQKVDNCCSRHTECYKTKTARDACDTQFCACAKTAAEKIPLCDFQMDSFCNTAKSFGAFNYKG